MKIILKVVFKNGVYMREGEKYSGVELGDVSEKEKVEGEIIGFISGIREFIDQSRFDLEFEYTQSYFYEHIGVKSSDNPDLSKEMISFGNLLDKIREHVRKHPETWIEQSKEINDFIFKQDVFNEAISSIGVTDVNKADKLFYESYEELMGYKPSDDQLKSDLIYNIYPKILDKKFRIDFEEAVEFAKTYTENIPNNSSVVDGNLSASQENVYSWLTRTVNNQLDSPAFDADPNLTLKIIDYILDVINEEERSGSSTINFRLDVKNSRFKQMGLRMKVAKKLRKTDPERALELFDDNLEIMKDDPAYLGNYGENVRERYLEDIEKGKIMEHIQQGNWEQAIELLKFPEPKDGKERRSGYKYMEIVRKFDEMIRVKYFDNTFDKNGDLDLQSSGEFINSLPQDVPGFRTIVNEYFKNSIDDTCTELKHSGINLSRRRLRGFFQERTGSPNKVLSWDGIIDHESDNYEEQLKILLLVKSALLKKLELVPEAVISVMMHDTSSILDANDHLRIYKRLIEVRGNVSNYNIFTPVHFEGADISEENLQVIYDQIFDQKRKNKQYNVLSKDLVKYTEQIRSLSSLEREDFIIGVLNIEGPESIVENIDLFLGMSVKTRDALFDQIVEDERIQIFFDMQASSEDGEFIDDNSVQDGDTKEIKGNFYKKLGVNSEELICALIKKHPKKFGKFFSDSLSFVGMDEDMDYSMPKLSEKIQSALINELLKSDPDTLINIQEIITITDHSFDKSAVQKGYISFVSNPSKIGGARLISSKFKVLEEFTKISPDVKKVVKAFLDEEPNLVQMLDFMSIDSIDNKELKDNLPWFNAIKRLIRLQERSVNQEHDPWVNDLTPLVEKLTNKDVISYANVEDGELFADFVQLFGAINAPRLCSLYIELKRCDTLDDLSERSKELLNDTIGSGRLKKMKEPSHVINELRRQKRNLVSDLLQENIPQILESELGGEILSSTIGESRWGRSGSVGRLIIKWKETKQKENERISNISTGELSVIELKDRTELPEGYDEVVLDVKKRVRRDLNVDETQKIKEKSEKLLSKKYLTDVVSEFVDSFSVPEIEDNQDHLLELIKNILDQLNTKLEKLRDRLERLKQDKNVSKQINDVLIKTEIQYQAISELDITDFFKEPFELVEDNESNTAKEVVLHKLLEVFADMQIKGEYSDKLIRTLSAMHIKQVIFDGFRNIIDSDSLSKYSKGVVSDDLYQLSSFVLDYLSEHYLHSEQQQEHTGHSPFSEKLAKTLLRVWNLQGGAPKHPFINTKNKLEGYSVSKELGEKTTEIAMVPSHGLMRILSGDTGNACFTSKQDELSAGEYPDLHAYTFVTGRNTAHERFAGSVLFVETKSEQDGKGVLLVRANNPRENLIQNVDSESLVKQTLDEAINLAKRRGLDCVVVPLDQATASSSNRPAVSEYYKLYFSENERLQLKNQPETRFNGYNNYHVDSAHKSVIIWRSEAFDVPANISDLLPIENTPTEVFS